MQSRLSEAEVARELCDQAADPERGVLLCDRIQSLWAARCRCMGTIESIAFELIGTDEMTVDAYLDSFSFDLEFLSPA